MFAVDVKLGIFSICREVVNQPLSAVFRANETAMLRATTTLLTLINDVLRSVESLIQLPLSISDADATDAEPASHGLDAEVLSEHATNTGGERLRSTGLHQSPTGLVPPDDLVQPYIELVTTFEPLRHAAAAGSSSASTSPSAGGRGGRVGS